MCNIRFIPHAVFESITTYKYLHSSDMGLTKGRSPFNGVKFIPNVGFYSMPKIVGRTGRFIYDGLRLISFGQQPNTKNHKHCVKAQDCFGRNSRPPIASQWAAVRITTEACRRKNPQITPASFIT